MDVVPDGVFGSLCFLLACFMSANCLNLHSFLISFQSLLLVVSILDKLVLYICAKRLQVTLAHVFVAEEVVPTVLLSEVSFT
uniref:Uncharacterized protein n=1 Tax=Arion vulgaris TaxID=1028688 RepID=A0A0B7A0I5_9EUPU